DPEKEGFLIHGVPVLGPRSVLPDVIRAQQVNEVIIALPMASSSAVREVVSLCTPLGVELKTLPSMHELIDGKVSISQIRNVEIEDVLQRDSVQLDMDAISGYLTGETVLVTGAGGSIGSELCRQIVRFKPKRLLILGHGENSIYEIDLELGRMGAEADIVPIIADVQDLNRIDQVFSNYRPGVVFHAAAHKHVPLMEANPEEAVKNNVFGTRNVAEAAHRHGSKRFVLISTDKAVNPANVMGASKRVAELVVQELSRRSSTTFVAVRFGNVLGSRGSVIPLFKRQIAQGGPVTVTHPDMTRYFMTIPEAAQLVIQAGAMGQGGEIFLLDMGKPVRILDLAVDLIRLSGFEPYVDIPIEFVGVRPGEKLNEELLTSVETTVATKHNRIVVAKQQADGIEGLPDWLAHLEEMAHAEASAASQIEWQAQLASYRLR
ncbi:MAG: polysaccharide biosynthesis protein, partial [Acidobacteriaceae bacterium]